MHEQKSSNKEPSPCYRRVEGGEAQPAIISAAMTKAQQLCPITALGVATFLNKNVPSPLPAKPVVLGVWILSPFLQDFPCSGPAPNAFFDLSEGYRASLIILHY